MVDFSGNYEDNPDLLSPDAVVSLETLARLGQVTHEQAERLRESAVARHDLPSELAEAAIRSRITADCAPGRGAPPDALEVELDAAEWGFRFGRLLLGKPAGPCRYAPREVEQRADAVNLYELLALVDDQPGQWKRLLTEVVFERHAVDNPYSLEEACSWAFAFGFGVAVIEMDGSSAA